MSGTQQQVPVSMLIRQGQQLDDVDGKRRSKDEYRKQKDLEEQRKAGQAPAMVDIETGRDINPHIPEFIEKTPWYVPTSGPTLKHQRPHPEREQKLSSISEWYAKGTSNKVAFKYRDGACENCGAMGHSKKTCLEKPRAIGAKYSNTNFAPDDNVLPSLKMGWDAKRDRWNGYDSAQYKQVHDEFERMEDARKMIKAQNIKDGIPDAEDEQKEKEAALEASKKDEADDEDKYADDMAPVQGVDMDSRTRITVRNLRIREDTAKYLYNLDENGAHYDPKSRSMRENPFANMPGKEQEAAKFSGENFIRYTGEVVKANEAQVFAWTARCQGIDVHALAEPTKLEALKREYEKEKSSVKGGIKQDLVDKYGGQEYLANAPPKELLLAQTENYVEYNRKGKVVKGQERPAVKSRYDEDIFINNHTQVWGSYWKDNRWGYKCCHELTKNSYCLGEEGLAREKYMETVDLKKLAAASAAFAPGSSKQTNKDEISMKEESKAAAKTKDKENGGSEEDEEKNANSDKSGVNSDEEKVESEAEEVDEEEKLLRQQEYDLEQERRKRVEKKREGRREKRRRQKERRKNKDPSAKKIKKQSNSSSSSSGSSSDSSNSSSDDDEVKVIAAKSKGATKELTKAIRKVQKEELEGKKLIEEGDRKRKYNSNFEVVQPTEVEKEAYNLTRIHASDPMAAYMTEKKEITSKKSKHS